MPSTHLPKLVGRDAQRQLIAQSLDLLSQPGQPEPPLSALEFYGLAGLGKSRLLEEAKELCRQRQHPFVLIDFHPEAAGGERSSPLAILLRLCDQLDHYFPQIFLARAAVMAATRAPREEEEQQRLALQAFAGRLADALREQPLIVLLDSTENCHDATFGWLGAALVPALLETGRIRLLLIAGGRAPRLAGWNIKPPVLSTFRLDRLDFKATEEHVEQLDERGLYNAAAHEIYRLSSGHPYSTEAIVGWLGLLGGDALPQMAQRRELLAQRLYDEVIRRYILLDPPEWLVPLVEVACVMRRFDAAMLRQLLHAHRPEVALGKEIQWFIMRLTDLTRLPRPIVLIGEGSPGYELEPTLRQLLHTALATLRGEQLRALHATARDLLDQLFRGAADPVPDTALLTELIYHAAQIELLAGGAPGPAALAALRDYLGRFRPGLSSHQMKLHELADRLGQDAELAGCLGAPAIAELRASVEVAMRPLRHAPPSDALHLMIQYSPPADYTVSCFRLSHMSISQQRVQTGRQFELEDWRRRPEHIGKAAFRVYLSQQAQELLCQGDAPLLIFTDRVEVPWELLHDGKEFLCLRAPTARRPMQAQAPREHLSAEGAPLRALVVGNPTGDLPSAQREAEEVAALLRGVGVGVDLLVGPGQASAEEFIVRISTEHYHLIHYAGHGHFDPQPPVQGGLDFAQGQVFGEELGRCLDSPAFLYLSACEIGQGVGHESTFGIHGRFMEGVAVQALLGGATGCLGPLWPIDDAVAREFALAFYHEAVGQALPISEAVRRARQSIRGRSPDFWASWVLYGDLHSHLFQPL